MDRFIYKTRLQFRQWARRSSTGDRRSFFLLGGVLFFVTTVFLLQGKLLGVPGSSTTVSSKVEWSSGYQIADTCELRPNRVNPRRHPDMFPCPVKYEPWGKFTNMPMREWDFAEATLDKNLDPEMFSWKNCTSEFHCEYKRVCVKGGERKVIFHQSPIGKLGWEDFGWVPYKELGPGGRKSFSWNYQVKIVNHTFGEVNNIETVKWIPGTSIWYDQSYANICHPGHSSEFYCKLVELRRQFPGSVDRIIYAKDAEFKDREDAYQYCHVPCNMMRIGFEDRDWDFPPIYWLENQTEWKNQQTVCFEHLLVPANMHQHFTSRQAAHIHRAQALKMCGIPERPKYQEGPKKVFFFSRVLERMIHNIEQLCEVTQEMGFESYVESCDDLPDFCQQVATIYNADIIVTIDGSSNQLLAYARPGSVVIIVYPYNFRAPDWKVLANMLGLRVLEILTVDRTLSLQNPIPEFQKPYENRSLHTPMIDCHGYNCRAQLRHRNTIVPVSTFKKFFNRSLELFQNPDMEKCEESLPWPVIPIPPSTSPYINEYQTYSFAMNYEVCDLPGEDCVCCKSKECMDASQIRRGFCQGN